MNTVQTALLLCVHICALPLAATPILVTANTVNDPAPRTLNTSGTYCIADSATLTFRNSLGATGTDGGVFAYNGSATYALLFTATGATDPATGFPAGTGAVVFENNHADKHGGAISIANTRVTLTLANATFAFNNTGSGNGGALVTNGTSRIHNAVFTSNTAGASGGAFQNTGNATLSAVRFEGNVAATTGGAIYNSTNSLTLTGGAFANNSAGGNGGALYNTGANTHLTLTDAAFSRNESAASGGALYLNSGTATITRAQIDSNKTTGASSSHGGAFYNNNASLILSDVVFTGNTAASNGGAIYATRGVTTIQATVSATNTGNKAGASVTGTNGGFLYVTGTDAVVNFDIAGATTRYVIGDPNAADRALDSISSGGSGAAATAPVINKNGDGVLILNANNSGYRGRINVNAGALLLGNADAKLNAAAITISGGVLGGLGGISGAVEFLATSTLFIDDGLLVFATTATTGVTLRDGATINGSGTLALAGAQNALHLDSGTITAAVAEGNTLTLASVLSGSAAFEKRDAGLLVFTATANTFSGGLVLSGGTLAFADSAQLGAPANCITFASDATLALMPAASGLSLSNTFVLAPAAHAALDTQARDLALTGALAGSGTLSKIGAGSLDFENANTSGFSGVLRIAEGCATLTAANFGGGALLESGAQLAASGTIAGSLITRAGSTLRLSPTNAPATLIVGGTLASEDSTFSFGLYDGIAADGFLNSDRIYAASVVMTGSATIDMAGFARTGTYNLGNIAPLAGARVTVGGAEQLADFRRKATLATSGSLLLLVAQIDMSRALIWTGGSGTAATLWSGACAGQWSDSGSVSRFADGDRVTFQNTNASIEIPANVIVSDMRVSTGGTLAFTGEQITADAASVITGELVNATGRLVKSGAGTLCFENAANDFLGGIVLENGTLVFSRAEQLGDGGRGIAITGSATLSLAATSSAVELANTLSLSPTAAATIDTGANALVLTGAISGSGALTKTGSGILTLSASAAHKGVTTIEAGTLRAAAPNVLSRDSHIELAAGAALDLAGHAQTIRSLATRGIVVFGAGSPRLAINGDYAAADGAGLHFTLALADDAPPQIGSLAISGSASGRTLVSIHTLDTRGASRNTAIAPDLAPLITTAAASPGAAFVLADVGERIVIGAYDYVLQPDNCQAARSWRLALDDFSPEIPAVAGTDALALHVSRAAMDALAARLDDLRAGMIAGTWRKPGFNIWADALYRRDSLNKTIYTGASVSVSGLQAGVDFTRQIADRMFSAGLFTDFSDSEMRFASRASSDAATHGAGIYATLSMRPWRFAVILRGAKAGYDIHTHRAATFEASGKSCGAAFQAAREIETRSGWRIEPLAELTCQRHSLDQATDAFGRVYAADDFSSLTARIATAFERAFGLKNNNVLVPRVRLGAVNEFQARSRMHVAGTFIETDLGGLAAELDAALVWRTAARWSFSAHAATRAGGSFDGYNLALGANCAW